MTSAPLRIIAVDDNEDISDLFRTLAEYEDVSIIYFRSGVGALAFLENNEADVVILDLKMSPLDGLTIAEQIRLNEKNYPLRKKVEIVFLTGAEITESVRRIAALTCVRKICPKPCDLVELMAEIKGWYSNEGAIPVEH